MSSSFQMPKFLLTPDRISMFMNHVFFKVPSSFGETVLGMQKAQGPPFEAYSSSKDYIAIKNAKRDIKKYYNIEGDSSKEGEKKSAGCAFFSPKDEIPSASIDAAVKNSASVASFDTGFASSGNTVHEPEKNSIPIGEKNSPSVASFDTEFASSGNTVHETEISLDSTLPIENSLNIDDELQKRNSLLTDVESVVKQVETAIMTDQLIDYQKVDLLKKRAGDLKMKISVLLSKSNVDASRLESIKLGFQIAFGKSKVECASMKENETANNSFNMDVSPISNKIEVLFRNSYVREEAIEELIKNGENILSLLTAYVKLGKQKSSEYGKIVVDTKVVLAELKEMGSRLQYDIEVYCKLKQFLNRSLILLNKHNEYIKMRQEEMLNAKITAAKACSEMMQASQQVELDKVVEELDSLLF